MCCFYVVILSFFELIPGSPGPIRPDAGATKEFSPMGAQGAPQAIQLMHGYSAQMGTGSISTSWALMMSRTKLIL